MVRAAGPLEQLRVRSADRVDRRLEGELTGAMITSGEADTRVLTCTTTCRATDDDPVELLAVPPGNE
ncbi:MAG: hypothetical protein S0880_35845 [Actinomycetota bacterium]|nr:hypothetical protein [Actinomycetota bacterium]